MLCREVGTIQKFHCVRDTQADAVLLEGDAEQSAVNMLEIRFADAKPRGISGGIVPLFRGIFKVQAYHAQLFLIGNDGECSLRVGIVKI